jgi:hypothetical protein
MNASRDSPGNLAKFVPPLVANGRVYLATASRKIAVYGLNPFGPAAAPTFTPTAGVYANAQSLTLASPPRGPASSTLPTHDPIDQLDALQGADCGELVDDHRGHRHRERLLAGVKLPANRNIVVLAIDVR